MAFPTIFNSLSAGNEPLSLFDTMFSVVGSMAQIVCTATGTNTLTLTPVTNMPTVSAYANYQIFGFISPNTSTGFVTLNVSGLGALNAYEEDGGQLCGANSMYAGQYNLFVYNSALNSGAGGFQRLTMPGKGQIVGTATNDSANTGNVGEYLSSIVANTSPVSLTTSVPTTLTSLSLTAGDWDVSATAGLIGGSTTVLSFYNFAINAVSATIPVTPTASSISIGSTITQTGLTGFFSWSVGTLRLNLASTTTVYLVAEAAFTTSTCSAYGIIGARRSR